MITFYDMSGIGKSIETENRLLIALGSRVWREWGVTANGCGVSIWGNENILKLMVVTDV
jgi:hypothetical protein